MRPEGSPHLPPDYRMDESDPDVLALKRTDGTVVAFFSAQGATREDLEVAAWEDYERRGEHKK